MARDVHPKSIILNACHIFYEEEHGGMLVEDYVYFIYVTENKVNGKLYIGQHHCRYSEQFTDGYFGSGTILLKAIKKYGAENFERIILEYADSPEELNVLEAKYVDEEVIKSDRFYNVKTGGKQCCLFSDETKKKISENQKGKVVSEESRRKMSEVRKGRRAWNKGIPTSEEIKEKQSIARKKWWQTRKLSMTVDGSPNIEE